jgi:4-hydroxybenzoate polyprenyltransferase
VIGAVVEAARPHQWMKNCFVFAAPLFGRRLFDPVFAPSAAAAFAAFCLAASAVYLLNDVADRERDRAHPVKRHRPVASGRLAVGVALPVSACLALSGVALGLRVEPVLGALVATYVVVQTGYCLGLRSVVLVDVFCIASGFVLRVLAGAAAVRVPVSQWLVLTTIFLSLFLALCKRRAEATELGSGEAPGDHRTTLREYTPAFLDELIAVTTASVVLSYGLYTQDVRTVQEFGTRNMVLTVPFVLFGVFRYLFLVHRRGRGAAPVTDALRDPPSVANAALWLAATLAILGHLL